MIYYELKISVKLNKNMRYQETYNYLSKFISRAMIKDKSLKEYHEGKFIKGYVFSSLYPIEKDKTYKAERVYLFNLRSLQLKFIMKLKHCLENSDNLVFKVLACQLTNYPWTPITQIKTLTPIVCTLEKGEYWTKQNGIKTLMERINICALKKYRRYIGKINEQEDGFIESIELLNYKPIKVQYKKTSLIGNKIKISCKQDEYSQKLAFTTLGAGLEKGTIGMGYFIMHNGR